MSGCECDVPGDGTAAGGGGVMDAFAVWFTTERELWALGCVLAMHAGWFLGRRYER